MPPITGCDAPFGPWITPGLTARLKELHAAPQLYSNTEIARMLSREFEIAITRNSVIGKCARLGLSYRLGARKGGGSRPGRERPRPAVIIGPPLPPPTPVRRIRSSGSVTLIELRDGDCHWPFGDGPSCTFCGEICLPDRPYCPEHFRMAHVEPQKRWA